MILYFKPNFGDDLKAIHFQNIAKKHGFEVNFLDEKDLSLTVEELLEGKRGHENQNYADKESFVLFDIEDEDLDRLLIAMRESNFQLNLKAKTTASNKAWSLGELINHVREESKVMQAIHKLYKLYNVSKSFEYQECYDKAHWNNFKIAQEKVELFIEKVGKEEIELEEVNVMMADFNQSVLTLIKRGE